MSKLQKLRGVKMQKLFFSASCGQETPETCLFLNLDSGKVIFQHQFSH
jgi:hypothetical protein